MSDTRDTIKNAVFDYWVQTTVPLIFDDRFSTKDLVNKVVQYVNNLMGDVRKLTTSDITYIEEIIEELVEGKLDAPATPGTAGQVLTSDGSGGQVWANVGAGEIVVDPSLTVSGAAADAKVTGDEISGLKSDLTNEASASANFTANGYFHLNPSDFSVGGINTETGAVDNTQTKRIVTESIMTAPYDMIFTSETGYKFRVVKYTNGAMSDSGTWRASGTSTSISKGQTYRIMIANYPDEVTVKNIVDLIFGVTVNTLFVDLIGCVGVIGEAWG